jgi:hypothetical protein
MNSGFATVQLLVLSMLCGTVRVSAIPGTPLPDLPAACEIPARTRTEIAMLLADSSIGTPAATTEGQTLPHGKPVDNAVATHMGAIVRQWLACQNAGETLRAWSLFSDGYLFRLLSRQGGLSDVAYAGLATPALVAEDAAMLLEIRGERELPDGRYGATVVIAYPAVPMPKTFFFFFTEEDGRLVIDGILGEISFAVP